MDTRRRLVLKALMSTVGLRITIDPIGSGALSSKTASKYARIRIESTIDAADR